MSTTARMYFVQDVVPRQLPSYEERVYQAKHRAPDAVLWVVEDGYPRRKSSGGLLDEFESFLSAIAFKPAINHARMLAGQFVWWHADRDTSDLNIYPTVPTVGAIVSWEYLIICHPVYPSPTVLVREGWVWQKEKDLDRD